MSDKTSKYDIKFEEMVKNIKEKKIDLDALPESPKKTINHLKKFFLENVKNNSK